MLYTVRSDCGQRARRSTGDVGHARAGKVVSSCRFLHCALSHVNERRRDAWAKHKDLDPYEAKWLYVDALLRVWFSQNAVIPVSHCGIGSK
jgi:hypothetical protein